jgi:hypothetical protein
MITLSIINEQRGSVLEERLLAASGAPEPAAMAMSSVCGAPLAEKHIAKPGGERPKGLSRLIHEPPPPTTMMPTRTPWGPWHPYRSLMEHKIMFDWTLKAVGSNTVEGGMCNNAKGRDLLGDQSVDGRIRLTFRNLASYMLGRPHRYPPNTTFYIFFQQLYILNFLNILHTLRFFLCKL